MYNKYHKKQINNMHVSTSNKKQLMNKLWNPIIWLLVYYNNALFIVRGYKLSEHNGIDRFIGLIKSLEAPRGDTKSIPSKIKCCKKTDNW